LKQKQDLQGSNSSSFEPEASDFGNCGTWEPSAKISPLILQLRTETKNA